MNTREKVLKEALNCVNGEREKQYGNPEDNFKRIADLWSVYLTSLFEDEKVVVDIDPIDVAKMMILFKIARSNGDKDKMDNYVDTIGYAACAAEIFECSEKAEKVLKKKEELGVQLADECKDCDYAKKCIGTGVCLKEEEKKWFDGCREAIDKCMCDQVKKKPDKEIEKSDSFWDTYQSISDHITSSSKANSVDCFDVVDWLIKNGHAPTDMASLLLVGRLNSDAVVAYIEKAINEVKKKENVKCLLKQVEDRKSFNEDAEQMIQKLKTDKKITRGVEVPEGFDIHNIYMTDAGQIIVRFNPIEEDKK